MDGNFIIKYRDLHDLSEEFNLRLTALIEGVDNMEEKINAFIDDESYTGEGATSIKAYFTERHIPMLEGFKSAAQSLLDNVAVYKGSYYAIDFATNFVLNREAIEQFDAVLYGKYTNETEGLLADAKAALDGVSDIFSNYQYPQSLENGIGIQHTLVKSRIESETFIPNILAAEDNAVLLLQELTYPFLNAIEQTNASIGTDWNGVKSYEPGSLADNECFNALKVISTYYNELHAQNAEAYEQIWDVERQLNEMAAEREANGAMKIIGAIGLAIGGVVCIVATWGAATPIVVGGVIAGGGTLLFAASDTIEGVSDMYYGSIGDIDSGAINPMKSLVYACGGDDETYNMIEQAFSFAASCMSGVGAASRVGDITFKTVVNIVGKEAVSTVSGDLAGDIVTNLTDSELLGSLANTAVSMATSKGMDALETRAAKAKVSSGGVDAADAPKVEMETPNVDVDAPRVDADIDVNVDAPKANVDIDTSGVDFDVDIDGDINRVAGGTPDDLKSSSVGGKIDDVADDVSNVSTKVSTDDLLRKVENGEITLDNTLQKGNFGEMETDAFMKDLGYERVSLDTVTGLDDVGHKGIDGIYYKADGNPPYVIVESKYGTSKLSKLSDGTLQMSDDWLTQTGGTLDNNRIFNDIVGDASDPAALARYKDIMDGLDSGTTGKVLANVDSTGNVKASTLDSAGKKGDKWP